MGASLSGGGRGLGRLRGRLRTRVCICLTGVSPGSGSACHVCVRRGRRRHKVRQITEFWSLLPVTGPQRLRSFLCPSLHD